MAVEVLLVGGLAALLAFGLASATPRLAWGIVWGRRIFFGFFALIGAAVLIATNQPRLMAFGALVVLIIALVIAVDQPHEDVW